MDTKDILISLVQKLGRSLPTKVKYIAECNGIPVVSHQCHTEQLTSYCPAPSLMLNDSVKTGKEGAGRFNMVAQVTPQGTLMTSTSNC